MNRLHDRGAQNERTRLAWQRTTLSLVACALVVARLVGSRAVVAGVIIAVASLVVAAALTWSTRARYASAQTALHAGRPLPDGRIPALLTLLLVVSALGGAALLVWTPTWGG